MKVHLCVLTGLECATVKTFIYILLRIKLQVSLYLEDRDKLVRFSEIIATLTENVLLYVLSLNHGYS